MRIQVAAGAVLALLGILTRTGFVPQLEDFVYPILWWGVLALVDAWNRRRRGLTLWNAHTLAIVVPASVLFWVFFEFLNLASPQWRYRGGLDSFAGQVVLGFISFATVIPIVVESWWAIAGRVCIPFELRRYRGLCLVAAIVFALVPLVNHVFWFNQGMWLAPGLTILPWVGASGCARMKQWLVHVAFAGILSGFCWEAFNYGIRTHWEYLILRDWPHLFQMPVLGYLGFVPFAVSVLATYEILQRIRVRLAVSIALYVGALAGTAVMTHWYAEVGLWRVR